MRQRIWRQAFLAAAGVIALTAAAQAQAPARPNAGFSMVYPGQLTTQRPTAAPAGGVQQVGGHETWAGPTGCGAPVIDGHAQPKYGWDAYPAPGWAGMKQGCKAGCANPITCGNIWSEKTFIFGSCSQFFGHGRGCGGWLFGGRCVDPIRGTGAHEPFNTCCYDSYLNH